MQRLLIIALCLTVFSLPVAAGDIPIPPAPPKCGTCSTAQPTPTPTTKLTTTTSVPGEMLIGPDIVLLLIGLFV